MMRKGKLTTLPQPLESYRRGPVVALETPEHWIQYSVYVDGNYRESTGRPGLERTLLFYVNRAFGHEVTFKESAPKVNPSARKLAPMLAVERRQWTRRYPPSQFRKELSRLGFELASAHEEILEQRKRIDAVFGPGNEYESIVSDNSPRRSDKSKSLLALEKYERSWEPFAYHGYYVQPNRISNLWSIQKDGVHIGWAKTPEEARTIIDSLTNPPRVSQPSLESGDRVSTPGGVGQVIKVTDKGIGVKLDVQAKRDPQYPGTFFPFRFYRGKIRRLKSLYPVGLPARNPVTIYERVRSIVAVKGPGHKCDAACKRARHTYIHRFTTGPRIIGEADGSLRIKS